MRSAFTLIELLVVVGILAVLAVVVVLTLNPAALLQGSRDSNRLSDMATLNSGINLFAADVFTANSLGTANTLFVSIPDPMATSTAGDQCQGLGLPSLPSGWNYQCAASSTFRKTDGTGWIPINFSQATFGAPFGQLPVDPTNTSSSRLYYTYTTDGQRYELTAAMEAPKNKLGGSGDKVSTSGGTLMSLYKTGSSVSLEPLDYGDSSLVGYWTFDEGSGSTAYDYSGNNATGSWNGTAPYYTASSKVGAYAGSFDGTTDYSSAADAASLQLTSAGTVSLWIYPTAYAPASDWRILLNKGNWGAGRNSYNMYYQSSNSTLRFEVDSGSLGQAIAVAQTVTPLNTWSHLTMTWDGATILAYVNGVQQGNTAMSSNPNTSGYALQLGTSGAGGHVYAGYEDNLRIYNRALSAAEIQAIYNASK